MTQQQVAPGLTPREHEVLDRIAHGDTWQEIAQALYISESTAKTHGQHLRAKLAARNSAHLVAQAYKAGLLAGGRP